jgi:cob(I)alamin adenosyltransferase
VVGLVNAQQTKVPQEVLVYLNRLGDLLFVMAREANRLADHADVPWSRGS